MSFLSGLSNIFHGLGHILDGGNDNQQQQNNQPQPNFMQPPTQAPGQVIQPQQQRDDPAPQLPSNTINPLFQPMQKVKLKPQVPVAGQTQPTNLPPPLAPVAPTFTPSNPGSPMVKVDMPQAPPTHLPAQVQAAGAMALAAPRVVEGLVKGTLQLPSMGAHVGQWLANKITGKDAGPNPLTQKIDSVTNTVTKPIDKMAEWSDKNSGVLGPDIQKLYKPAQVGENVGAAVPAMVAAVSKAPALISKVASLGDMFKANPKDVIDAARVAEANAKTPDEISAGLKSVNPDQATDAAAVAQQKEIQANNDAVNNTQTSPTENASVASTESVQTPPQKTEPVQSPAPQTQEGQPLAPVPEASPVSVTGTPTEVSPPTEPIPSENPSSSNPPSSTNVAQGESNVNPTGGKTAPNAPDIQSGLEELFGGKGKGSTHEVLNMDEAKASAERTVAQSDPEELIRQNADTVSVPNSGQAVFNAIETIRMLSKIEGNPEADKAVANLIDGISQYSSKAGQGGAVSRAILEDLPRPMQISVTMKNLNKARVAAGMPPIGETATGEANLAEKASVEAKLNELIEHDEALKDQQAKIEGRAQEITDNSGRARPQDQRALSKEASQLKAQNDKLAVQQAAHAGEMERYKGSLLPGGSNWEKPADWAKTSMLTAPTGRVNNVFNVSGNSLYNIVRSIPQAWMGKIYNAIKGAGTVEDKSLLNRGLISGFKKGVQQVGAELKGKQLLSGSMSKNSNPYELVKTMDNKGLNKIRNVTQALVRAPSNIIGGAMEDAQVLRSATQEGQAAGKTGLELKTYAKARAVVPTKKMVANSQLLKDVVSHMNKNPIADVLSGFGKLNGAPPQAKGVIGLVKNTLMAFPKYPATFAWNALTDHNIAANTARLVVAAHRGDSNAVIKALSGIGVDSGGMYIGYNLTNAGIITNKNGAGYSDSGKYLHIGDRYIPLGTIGMVAPDLIAGSAMHDAIHGAGHPFTTFMSTVGNTIWDTIKASGVQSLAGVGNTGWQDATQALQGKGGVSPADAGVALAAEGTSQFIPGITSDINSVINQTGLNPTHENAMTKVTKGSMGVMDKSGAPSTGTAIIPSTMKSMENRIPILSQSLPRNPGTTSNDIVDRMTRGDHVGTVQAKDEATKANATQSLASDIQNGVPVYKAPDGTAFPKGYSFDNTLKSAIQSGDYDKAITGLQGKIKVLTTPGPEHIPPSQIKDVQNNIKQLQVFKATKTDPAFVNTYSDTTNTEWKAMGNPTSDTYNPELYQKLYTLDQALAAQGVSGGNIDSAGKESTPKFALPKKSTTGRGSAASKAVQLVKSNTIGSLPTLARESFINNMSQPAPVLNLPEAKLTQPDSLIKAHKISVGMPKA